MKFVGVIPARYQSTRFPGKPLALINGVPMIQRVYQQAQKCRLLHRVVVATDHVDIRKAVEAFGGYVIMTNPHHETGSDRIAEVSEKIDGDYYINIQGDEPLIRPQLIDELIMASQKSRNAVITAKTRIMELEDIINPNVVKVVTDASKRALYFSRTAIPHRRTASKQVNYYKHLGIYCYPKPLLQQFVKWEASPLEQIEVLEQLRLLENGVSIIVVETDEYGVGVDVPSDIQKVEQYLKLQEVSV